MNRKIGNINQLCEAQRVMVSDGRGKGSRLIYCSNGKLNFVLSESNALDVLRLFHEGTNIGFLTKNGLYNQKDKFSHTFPAGMMYTCGLDNIGDRKGYEVHGRLHSIPAEIVEMCVTDTYIKIVGDIRDAQLFEENLLLRRTIYTEYGSDKLEITDVITNEAYRDENYTILYHINAGYPLVDDGTEIVGDFKESFGRTPWAVENMDKMLLCEEPSDNMEEMVYFHKMNVPKISLVNKKIGKKFTVCYSDDTVPYLNEWKSRGSGDYTIGIEPATSWLDEHFKYRVLKPGESVTNRITMSVEDIEK